MNAGMIVCSLLCLLFLIMTILFAIGKEKAAILISGFNSLSKKEREGYDKARMSSDQAKQCLHWTEIMGIGSLLSYVSAYFAIPVFVFWLLVFFKNVHFDDDTAFKEYKMKQDEYK